MGSINHTSSSALFLLLLLSLSLHTTNGWNDTQCGSDIEDLLNSKYVNPTTSFEMQQYSGKGPAQMGNWDECQNIGKTIAQYCVIAANFSGSDIEIGVCAPSSCSEDALADFGTLILSSYGAGDIMAYCHNQHKKPTPDGGAIGVIVVLIICGLLVLSGSLLEYADDLRKQEKLKLHLNTADEETATPHHAGMKDVSRREDVPLIGGELKQQNSLLKSVLLCFAIRQNLHFLTNDKHSTGPFSMLNGMRVLMMIWVILGHTPYFQLVVVGYDNILYVSEKVLPRFSFQVFIAAEYAVDVFFFLSGFLVTFLTYEELKHRRFSSWIYYYVHRYWRLTPVYALVLFFAWKLVPFMGKGPFWFEYSEMMNETCGKYWWTNLLYINNLYPYNYTESCIGWAWYLANDMQFFCLVPVFLLAYRYSTKAFWALITLLTVAYFGVNMYFIIHYYHSLGPGSEGMAIKTYPKPYTRIGPYLLGVCIAFLVADHRKAWVHIFHHPVYRWVSYLISFSITFVLSYCSYWQDNWHEWEWVAHFTFSRYAFCVAVAIFVLACLAGYGGIVNWFLSATFWAPFSKLTYCAYLIHPVVMESLYLEETQYGRYSWSSLSYYFIGNLVFAYALALALHLIIEKPCSNLERLLRTTLKNKQ